MLGWETKGCDSFVVSVSALTDEGSWASADRMSGRDVADSVLNDSAAPARDPSSGFTWRVSIFLCHGQGFSLPGVNESDRPISGAAFVSATCTDSE